MVWVLNGILISMVLVGVVLLRGKNLAKRSH